MTNGNQRRDLSATETCTYDWAFGAVEEVATGVGVFTCNQFPNESAIYFTNIVMGLNPFNGINGTPVFNSTPYNPTSYYPTASNNWPNCGYGMIFGAQSTELLR